MSLYSFTPVDDPMYIGTGPDLFPFIIQFNDYFGALIVSSRNNLCTSSSTLARHDIFFLTNKALEGFSCMPMCTNQIPSHFSLHVSPSVVTFLIMPTFLCCTAICRCSADYSAFVASNWNDLNPHMISSKQRTGFKSSMHCIYISTIS